MIENLKDETIEIVNTYSRRWVEINALHHIWFYMKFGFEYGTTYDVSTTINKMYHAAPMFFSISRIAIERTSRIELVKLFEGHDKATIIYLRKYLEEVSENLSLNSKEKSFLKTLNKDLKRNLGIELETIDSLKAIRNKHLVHSDLEVYINPSKLYEKNKVEIDRVFSLIKIIGDYLDEVSKLLGATGCPKYREIMDIQSMEMYFK